MSPGSHELLPGGELGWARGGVWVGNLVLLGGFGTAGPVLGVGNRLTSLFGRRGQCGWAWTWAWVGFGVGNRALLGVGTALYVLGVGNSVLWVGTAYPVLGIDIRVLSFLGRLA